MNIIVFEDAGVPQLFPVTTGRPAYAISCGGYRLIDWLVQLEGNLIGSVRPELETVQMHDFPECQSQLDVRQSQTWFVNARLVPSVANLKQLYDFKDWALATADAEVGTFVARCGWGVASAIVPTSLLSGRLPDQWPDVVASIVDSSIVDSSIVDSKGGGDSGAVHVDPLTDRLSLLTYPHEVVDQHLKIFEESLGHRIGYGDFERPQTDVYLGPGVEVGPQVVFDTGEGPIVIDADVRVGPFSLLRGPIYIGPHSKISEHAVIKDRVAISHHCKIGGEIEASIIEPYSNKQHHGFLGHSYLGSWINLGAGTCNSDLKNTYGTVNAQYGERKVSTGMQFFGCVMGDYAKTAINTSIFTGKIIGTASMVYGFATTNVPSFVNYARTFGEIGVLPPDVIVSTQGRMFARRNVTQRPCDIQLIHDMFRGTASERAEGLSDEPLSL